MSSGREGKENTRQFDAIDENSSRRPGEEKDELTGPSSKLVGDTED